MSERTPSPQSVVVPVEPTEDMMLAGALVGPDTNNGQFGYDDARTVFVAMLAAAPAPSSLAGGEVDERLHGVIDKLKSWVDLIQRGKRGEAVSGNPIVDCVNDLPAIVRELEAAELEIEGAFERYEDAALSPEAPACTTCGGKGYTEHEGGDGEGYPSRPEIDDCPRCHEAPAEGAGVVKACADFQEAIDYFEADVADALAEDSERADLWDREVTVNIDALKTVMSAALRARSSAPEAREEALGNLLAVIHGDGGHRAVEVGVAQAAVEAEKIVANLLSFAPEARDAAD